jgi:hypothetical protein
MPIRLSPVADTLDTVPESFRSLYEEREGRFVLAKDVEIETPETVAGMRSALEKEKRDRKALADRAKLFDGLDPDEVRTLVEERARAGDKDAERKGEWDKLKESMTAGFNKEKTALTDKVGMLTGRLHKLLATTAADAAMADLKANAKALRPHVLASLRVEEEEGETRVVVVDEAGRPRYNKRGELMTAADFVADLREDEAFKPFFLGAPGSGSEPPKRTAGGMAGGKRQVTAAQMRDPAFYREVAEEARKQGKGPFDIVNVVNE